MAGRNEHELMRLRRDGQVSQELLNKLAPFFDEIKQNIHIKWEKLSLEDGQGAKLLKFQLKTVLELERMIAGKITDGKIAAHDLEAKK